MLCCLCLLDNNKTIDIFDEERKRLNIADIIFKHFRLTCKEVLSTQICIKCWRKLNHFHVFFETVTKSYIELKNAQRWLPAITNEGDISLVSSIKEEETEVEDNKNVNRETEIEIDFDAAYSTRNPLFENEQECCNIKDQCSDSFSTDSSCKSNEIETKKYSKEKPFSSSKNLKTKKTSKRCREKELVKNSEIIDEPKRKKADFHRLDPLHTEEMIKKHIPMGCNLCVFVGKTFTDIVAHFKAEHPNTRAYITCCDKTFTKRFFVAQHAMTHENPHCFSCEVCSKSFTTTRGLQKHNIKYHSPDEELIFICEMCPQKFARQHLLNLHKTSHIPRDEWKFFCTKCPTSKAFASAYLLNIHDNQLHKREINICNVCAKEIKDKKSFEKHVRKHYESSAPRLKCPFPNCDAWLKDEDNLKLHIRSHNTDGKTYKCPLCDKMCPNRRALSSHKVYVHSKKVFKCDFCDKTLKTAITLREHMARHTGEILYNCPFCTRTFKSNANMHSHKKKQHPVEWQELKKQKMETNSN